MSLQEEEGQRCFSRGFGERKRTLTSEASKSEGILRSSARGIDRQRVLEDFAFRYRRCSLRGGGVRER